MIYCILFILISCSTFATAQNNTNRSCVASAGTETLCNLQLFARCPDASLWVEKPQWWSCSRNQLFWNYPKDNLTVTFIRPSVQSSTTGSTALRAAGVVTTTRKARTSRKTTTQKPSTSRKTTTRKLSTSRKTIVSKTTTGTTTAPQFCLSKDAASCTEVYRIDLDGTNTKVTWTNSSSICFRNPVGDNSFKFRFEGQTTRACFGVFIRYWFK